ncbi:hypothetical protein BT93_H0050 [Corymbia citriodora subsp. variegata]|nr:hypothetical protein BT93_H0050 [Corymbia citriodora subsp. variegata]
MNSYKLVIVLLVLASVAGHFQVEVVRALPEDFVRENNLATYLLAAYQRARYTMACWLEYLTSGLSPRRPHH